VIECLGLSERTREVVDDDHLQPRLGDGFAPGIRLGTEKIVLAVGFARCLKNAFSHAMAPLSRQNGETS
jgi:hypothetical protein